jgi:hypothetical protein
MEIGGSGSGWVDGDKRARFDPGRDASRRGLALRHSIRQEILGSNLDDAGAGVASKREERAEVKIVREDDVSATAGVIYDSGISSGWTANRGPMHGWPAALLPETQPREG